MFGDWFMAHTVDLLAASSSVARALLTAPLPHRGGSQAEFYLLDYAATLMPLASGWQVACEYLRWCPAHGAAATAALLAALPVTAPDQRLLGGAVLAAARRWGHAELVPGVWRCLAADAWLGGRVGEALAAAGWCRDGGRVGGVVVQGLVEAVRGALLTGDGRIPGRGRVLLCVWARGDIAARACTCMYCIVARVVMQPLHNASKGSLLAQLQALRPLVVADGALGASASSLLGRLADLLESLRALEGARGPQAAAVGVTVKQCLLAALQVADASLAVPILFAALPLLETQGGLLSWQEVHTLMVAVHGGAAAPVAMQQSVRLALVRSLARAAC